MAPAAPADASAGIVAELIKNDHVRWWNKPNLRTLYLLLVPFCLFIESTSGFDSSMMNGMQALKYWQDFFGHPKGGKLGLLVACYNLGALTSIPFISIVSDHVGRRWSIVFGSVIMIIGSIMQGLSVNLAMFVFSRIFLGHGIVYAIVAGAALLGELGHPKERAFLGSMFNAFYGVGAILGAGIVIRTLLIPNNWSWRLPSLLQALPSVIQIGFAFTVPESPRWLISKDRGEEALAILIKYHAEGDASNELPHVEYAEIKRALEIENEGRRRGWAELFQTPGMRHRSMVAAFLGVFVQFSGNNLISQYLVPILAKIGITDAHTVVRYNVGTQAWGFLVALTMASITPRFPRRRMYLLCASCLLCVYTAWTIAQARNRITKSTSSSYAVLVMIFLYQPAYCLGYNALTYVYLVELFPYYVRTKGLSWFQLFGRSAVMFGSFVNPIGLENADWKYLIVYVCWLCCEIVIIYFLFPETYGKTLEELTFLFESEQEDRAKLEQSAHKALGAEGPVTEVVEHPEKAA
ncbi:general substrate transporter [Aaosphaeria arxii CBS 175.79]|uniref:General substrate transporter n=1 Tax=Aaosphaeria arxii CBS 175.79 TaxID=1450172 RepID=A0A6A5Y521_9PLEO|nr:general substrate transporter [Aaosphaeria arxii CBS 175.79]KAF2020608.1 general substrate transporter [Aaosphaeria arxii CBS 175.79]